MTQPTNLFVCPTSHMDWDWTITFEQYYKLGTGNSGTASVQSILDAAVSLYGSGTDLFNVAELGWVQRYLVDQGGTLAGSPNLARALRLMGGAVTSPDNIVCGGEVFVRGYLIGRQWAQSMGLWSNIANVSWMPDDFGHDPELPIILSAMGLTAVGFARCPGAFPLFAQPLDKGASLACSLLAEGLAFNWQASDGSMVFAHFMPNTYGVPFYSEGADGAGNAAAWAQFINADYLSSYNCPSQSAVVWPGGVAFAPAGGDFALPDTGWVNGVAAFNQLANGTKATIGTFVDYFNAVPAADLVTKQIDPSNFYTGYFGSRPELKILQARASRDLVSAEGVSCLLRLGSVTGGGALDALDAAIAQVWSILAPSTHHDFVTGTSNDTVYKSEQLPMLSLAASLAKAAYRQLLQIIANSITPSGPGTVVVVHNPVGVSRSGVFKIEGGTAVNFEGSGPAMVQPLVDGGLLVQAPAVQSLGYLSGMVTSGKPATPKAPVDAGTEVTIDNGTISIILSQSQLWAITSIALDGGANLLPAGAANLLVIYHDTGNLYQYGNEPMQASPDPEFGKFEPRKQPLTAGKATQTEFGPLRWRVEAEVIGPHKIKYLIVYTLIAGESIVRISVTGSAPTHTTVVTTFPAIATDGTTDATHLIYGTAHHFHEDAATPYWNGPTFKATHDFLMPAADTAATFALAAIYHDGMPAWACDQGMVLGSLFRNTPGGPRGASGTDSDTHTQTYALRISTTALDQAQGTPLVEALQITRPLRAALASAGNRSESPVTMKPSASLASVTSPALIRVTRPMGEVKSVANYALAPQAQVALRIYRPDADGTETSVEVTMPMLTSASQATGTLITALEQLIPNAPEVTVNGDVLTVPTSFAITTIAVTATRPT